MPILNQLDDSLIPALHQLYQNEWWSKGRTLDETVRCVRGSSLVFACVEEGQLIAFARVVTDFVFKAFVFDVIVAESARGTGLGERMIDAVLNHPQLTSVKHVELYCKPELVPFYQRWNFTTELGPIHLMRRTQQ
ncbi:MAG TPA: GNAT family N-acetyltransferase [Dongiaceae bacterium]|nr:GNAT family N-acetyltransferase [Dongiaceae bacterium]